MAQVWIRTEDSVDLVRADSVGQISIWTAGSKGFVGLVPQRGKDALLVASRKVDFAAEPFDDEIVRGEADRMRHELVNLIHRWEADEQFWTVILSYIEDKWIVLS